MENGKRGGGTAVGRAVFVFKELKARFQHRVSRGDTECTEEECKKRVKIGHFVGLGCKSPPLKAKGGAPVIFQEVVHSI